MATPLNEWLDFGTKPYEQAQHNQLAPKDEIKVVQFPDYPVPLGQEHLEPDHQQPLIGILEDYTATSFTVLLHHGKRETFGWSRALAFRKLDLTKPIVPL